MGTIEPNILFTSTPSDPDRREDKKIRLLLEKFYARKLPRHIHDLVTRKLSDVIRLHKAPEEIKKVEIATNTDEVIAQIKGKEEGIQELMKEETKEEEASKAKLQELSSRNHVILMKIKTLFPFDFFPDTLIIDMTKVNIISKQFFATEIITNINLKDIIEVSAETAIFMGNLVITYVPNVDGKIGMLEPITYRLNLLRRRQALKAQRILKGILVARREGIEISKCSPEEIMHVVERFGDSKFTD
jgi:hypothetical protein